MGQILNVRVPTNFVTLRIFKYLFFAIGISVSSRILFLRKN
ncbi:hypothetical protein LEP1GSC059_4555 [Leptospira noguchii serovar Panama str. CZ214]|uniref:Uncharacterized protein n=1 Tax=Leptospira noguchii serovar Panama str. CZ214 TaxID=1001595 RepID=T0FKL5_9LEPT|nr:hypothetical protein LEP1GSC059_4555 [Leptospira noguchii serovar Panama str. CZ214]